MNNKIGVLVLILLVAVAGFVSALDIGLEGEIGIDLIPSVPLNYSLVPTVNSSDYWDALDTPSDISISDLAAATANFDLGIYDFEATDITVSGTVKGRDLVSDNEITAVHTIYGEAFQIGANELATTEWALLDGLDQALKTTDDVNYNTVTVADGFYAPAGSVGSLPISFFISPTTGMFLNPSGADNLLLVTDGDIRIDISSSWIRFKVLINMDGENIEDIDTIFALNWTNVSIIESQIVDLQPYLINGTNVNLLRVNASNTIVHKNLTVSQTADANQFGGPSAEGLKVCGFDDKRTNCTQISVDNFGHSAITTAKSLFIVVEGTEAIGAFGVHATTGDGQFTFNSNQNFRFGSSGTKNALISWRTSQTNDALMIGLSSYSGTGKATRTMIVSDAEDLAYDFAHPAMPLNPTWFMQSANQVTDEWFSLSHDSNNAIINVSKGYLGIYANNGSGIGLYVENNVSADDYFYHTPTHINYDENLLSSLKSPSEMIEDNYLKRSSLLEGEAVSYEIDDLNDFTINEYNVYCFNKTEEVCNDYNYCEEETNKVCQSNIPKEDYWIEVQTRIDYEKISQPATSLAKLAEDNRLLISELKQENQILKNCIINSQNFGELKLCVGGVSPIP